MAGLVGLCGVRAHALPMCAGPIIRTSVRLDQIDARGALLLHGGTIAHLEGIRLPLGSNDHAPDSFRRDSLFALSVLTRGNALTLTAVPPREDRYGRVRVQAFTSRDWIQAQLLSRGLARASIAPDRVDCAAELYSAETRGRALRAGIWSFAAYAVRRPGDLERDLGTFQIVEGRVTSVVERSGRTWIAFESPRDERFAALIENDDLRTFRAMGVDPRGYAGKLIRVRGIVQNLAGPAISIANPMQVEVVDPN